MGAAIVSVIAILVAGQALFSFIDYSKYVHPGDALAKDVSFAFDSGEIARITGGKCDFKTLYPSKSEVRKIEKHIELMQRANSKSNREILAYLRDASYAVEKSNVYQEDVPEALIEAFREDLLRVIEANEKLDPAESTSWLEFWKDDLASEIAKSCNVPLNNGPWAVNVNKFNALLSQLKGKAAQVPWYPEGYNAWAGDDTLAWKWYRGASCSISMGSCWHIKVITQTGCPSGLYAEINIMDGGGTVIDYSNDLLGGTRPDDTVMLEFTTFQDYAETGRLTELNCY